jgi:hypothetical protein
MTPTAAAAGAGSNAGEPGAADAAAGAGAGGGTGDRGVPKTPLRRRVSYLAGALGEAMHGVAAAVRARSSSDSADAVRDANVVWRGGVVW